MLLQVDFKQYQHFQAICAQVQYVVVPVYFTIFLYTQSKNSRQLCPLSTTLDQTTNGIFY